MNSSWMTGLNAFGAAWAENIVRASWQGGLLLLLVWTLCRVLPRLPAGLRCLLWWIACLRLAIGLVVPPITLPLLPPAPLPALHVSVSATPPALSGKSFGASTSQPAPASAQDVVATPETVSISLAGIALCVWLCGILVYLGITAFPLLSLRRLAAKSMPFDDLEIVALARKAADSIGLSSVPQVRITESDMGPFTLGASRPVVVVSRSDLKRLSVDELGLVLAHEFAHIRRGDVWLSLLPYFTQALFAFHPLVWLARREFILRAKLPAMQRPSRPCRQRRKRMQICF